MQTNKQDYKTSKKCDWCNYPDAPHEGGGELNGLAMSGNFCSKRCFDLWIQWKAAFINWLSQPDEMQSVEPREQPEQT